MSAIPPEPSVPEEQRASAEMRLRYEDVSQEGRVLPSTLPYSFGEVIWRGRLNHGPIGAAARRTGTVPILSRLVIEAGDAPVSVAKPLDARGLYHLAHSKGEGGEVDRLLLLIWTTMVGVRSRTHGPPPVGAGEPLIAGRVYGEHVFSRPFGPVADRKVRRFEEPGLPPVPEDQISWRPPEATLALPEDAEPLEEDFSLDKAPVVFGLGHTDSNEHVNSLVYPRLFEEAALRRLAAAGLPTAVFVKSVEMGYRKPSFAGDKARVTLRLFRQNGLVGAVGALVEERDAREGEAPDSRAARCFVRIVFGD